MLLYNTIVTEDKNFEKSTNEKKTEKKTDMDGGRTGRSFVSGTGRLFPQSHFRTDRDISGLKLESFLQGTRNCQQIL